MNTTQERMQTTEAAAARMFSDDACIDIIPFCNKYNVKCFFDDEGTVKNANIMPSDDAQGQFKIYVNPNHSKQRIRFSIAHELSHRILHEEEILKKGRVDRQSAQSLDLKKEKEADKLAARILMPKQVVLEKMHQLSLQKDETVPESAVQSLCEYFQVSFPAMIIRLRNLGYYVSHHSY